MRNTGAKIYTRDVLLSTGELGKEVVIRGKSGEVYETAPKGLTLGNNEAELLTSSKSQDISHLDRQEIFNLSQQEFDGQISSQFYSQITTALSLAFLRYKALERGFGESVVYRFVESTYGKKGTSPRPIFNILNGGVHANGALSFCEFMIIPQGENIRENVRIASEVYQDLRSMIESRYGVQNTMVGREGGFAPYISDIEEALSLIQEAICIRNTGKSKIALDVAANSFSRKGMAEDGEYFEYMIGEKTLSTMDLMKLYTTLLNKYHDIAYLEDPFNEEDLLGWDAIRNNVREDLLIVGDDLTVTNVGLLEKHKDRINACILKINQTGTVTGLINAFQFCISNNIKPIISQRSGETDSNIISHIATGLGSVYIKAGAPARERIIKYNTLVRIEDENSDIDHSK